ncbi:MAG: NTP transferase domain-containing protein [Candidatus Saganbacteria bacterium]|nr:NTP transferase domain-containing protein [Candidatus Saganbacteria bacterium]
MKNITAVILAAGKGTRMKSDMPKVLHKLCGKPLLSYVLGSVKKLGIAAPYVIVGYQAGKVKALYKGRSLRFVLQKKQLGTGHALMQTKPFFAGKNVTILVLNGDMPLINADVLTKLIRHHRKKNASATVLTALIDDPSGYGRVIRDKRLDIEKIVEQKDAVPGELEVKEINTGTYCFESGEIFSSLDEIRPENSQHEYYLTDIIQILKKHRKKISACCMDDPSLAIGVNTKEHLEAAEKIIKRKRTV